MSSMTRDASTAAMTCWRKSGENEYGQQTFNAPFLIMCAPETGLANKYAARGIEKAPKAIYHFEYFEGHPVEGDFVKLGDHTAIINPVSVSADIIKLHNIHDCSFLGEPNDVEIST